MAMSKEPSETLFITVSEAARYLRISRSKMYQMANDGQVPAVRVGKIIRIPENEFKRVIELWKHYG